MHPLTCGDTKVCGSEFEGRMHMCAWKPSARFEWAVVRAKERGHSAREGKETKQRNPPGQTELANPS